MRQSIKLTICKKYPFALNSKTTWEEFIELASAASKLYRFPKKITICQAVLESGRGTSLMSKSKNNYFGFMAYDQDPSKARSYTTALDSILDYLELITTTPRYSPVSKAKSALQKLETIQKCGYATDPMYVQKITSLREWDSL